MPIVVQKFGGASVADSQKIHDIAALMVLCFLSFGQPIVVAVDSGSLIRHLNNLCDNQGRFPPATPQRKTSAGRNLRFYHKLSVKFTNEKISFLVCRQFLLVKVEL